MATNDYLPFGTGAGANVLTQADYLALAARLGGFQAGVAKSVELNKVWRQSSVMASVLAQFIADATGQDVLDDGDGATLLAQLEAALLAASPGRLLRTSVYRNFGGTQQVSVDGGAFTSTGAGTFNKLPETNSAIIKVVGGGGGGGGAQANAAGATSAGAGGGSGAYGETRVFAGLTGVVVAVGAAGSAGTASGGGGSGATSSFGALVTAPGGAGGALGLTTSGFPLLSQGGARASTASGANIINSPGAPGGSGLALALNKITDGQGASSVFGGGGGSPIAGGPGNDGGAYGAGGGGGASTASQAGQPGGAGGSGVIIVLEYA